MLPDAAPPTQPKSDTSYDPSVLVQSTQQTRPVQSSLLSLYSSANENVQRRFPVAQYAQPQSPNMSVVRGDSPFRKGSPYQRPNESVDVSLALLPPSETHSNVFSAHTSPKLVQQNRFEDREPSPLMNPPNYPQDDPQLFPYPVMQFGQVKLNKSNSYISPGHSPHLSPQLIPQKNNPPASPSKGNPADSYGSTKSGEQSWSSISQEKGYTFVGIPTVASRVSKRGREQSTRSRSGKSLLAALGEAVSKNRDDNKMLDCPVSKHDLMHGTTPPCQGCSVGVMSQIRHHLDPARSQLHHNFPSFVKQCSRCKTDFSDRELYYAHLASHHCEAQPQVRGDVVLPWARQYLAIYPDAKRVPLPWANESGWLPDSVIEECRRPHVRTLKEDLQGSNFYNAALSHVLQDVIAPASVDNEQVKNGKAHFLQPIDYSVEDILLQNPSMLATPVPTSSLYPEIEVENAPIQKGITSRGLTPLHPTPSDSGYRSGKGTNTASICSEQSTGSTLGLSQDFLHDFIAFFTDTLIEKAGARQWAQYARARHSPEYMERRLTASLKNFAICSLENIDSFGLARGGLNSQQSRAVLERATGLVRRYRPKVARYFIEISLALPASTVSLSDRLRGLGQHLSLMERIGLLSKHGANNHSTLEALPNVQEDDIMDDDVDGELLAALSSIQDVLVSSDAFQQLAAELRRIFYRNDTKEMEIIQKAVLSNLGSQTRRLKFKAHFHVDWDILAFMYAQYGEIVPIASVVVLTGSAFYAQATTCGDYVRNNWPTTGPVFLELLDKALGTTGEEVVNKPDVSASTQQTFACIDKALDLEECFPELRMCVRSDVGVVLSAMAATDRAIVELAQILAWIGSALSSSPFGKELAYGKPSLIRSRQVYASKGVDKGEPNDMNFIITFEHTHLHSTENACWLPLFTGSSIATGFPIPDRAEEIGLEIPLELLAGIAGVYHATEFDGGLLMKGFCHMFVPLKKTDDRVQWHAITSQDSETRLTYRDALSGCKSRALLQEVNFDDIQSTRAFLGWCSVATSRLGSDAANFESIDYSGTQDAISSPRFTGCQVGFQQWVTAAANFSIGANQGKHYRRSSGPYHKILSVAETWPVVLYDAHEQRGWLVRATDVILHMIQHQHHLKPFKVNGERVHLDTNLPVGSSAKSFLMRNEKLVLSDDASDTFKHTAGRIWSTLEDLIEKNVIRDQNTLGTPINGTLRDFLQGYEFKAIVEERGIYPLKEKELSKTHGGWPLLARDIDALVLLADGFGEVILPADEDKAKLCMLWQRMPSGYDYLATTSEMLIDLYNVAGHRCKRQYLTSTQLQWHQGASQLFGACTDTKACQCNRLQQIVPKASIGTIVRPEIIIAEGAVIFGHSGSLLADLFSKQRPETAKGYGIYHHPNIALSPIDVPAPLEDTCSSDTAGQSGSDATAVSIPTSLSTCTIRSAKEAVPSTSELDVVMRPLSLPRKRTLLPKLPLVEVDQHRQGLEVCESAQLLKRKKRFQKDSVDEPGLKVGG